MWKIALTKRALKDAKKVNRAGLKSKVDQLLDILKVNPYQNPPPYEKLTGDLKDMYSRRINLQHRLVYEIDSENQQVKIVKSFFFQQFCFVNFFSSYLIHC
ncbi:Txe/YoeB family addiction module toxin [Crocosphaera subtropica]|nr:Txe/YoeB family addiction module toxin [Crocosphaera subtropica]